MPARLALRCAVLKARRRGWSRPLSVVIARGLHLFPFRTEQLSLSAPMVLGSQGPGRVGRRRFSQPKRDARAAHPGAARLTLAHSWPGRVGTGHTHTCARGATVPGRRRIPPRNARRWGCAPPSARWGRASAPPSSRRSAKSRTPSTSPRKDRAFGWRRGAERNMCSQARNGLGRNLRRAVGHRSRNGKALQIRGFKPGETATELASGRGRVRRNRAPERARPRAPRAPRSQRRGARRSPRPGPRRPGAAHRGPRPRRSSAA